jgi:hypothetical protein
MLKLVIVFNLLQNFEFVVVFYYRSMFMLLYFFIMSNWIF